ncbi:MAG: response regulator transcription factor [Armatimonadetes bacterium]|nr:response regulator transcription factor [Armatimonadota bacterium]
MTYGRVVVIDDDPDVCDLVRLCLEEAGFSVEIVRDGKAGLEAVDTRPPDLVVLDVSLPTLDGLTVCRELRRRHNMPILMLSARGQDVDKVVGLEVGADDYLSKPFNPRELEARVRALFRRWTRLGAPGQERELLVRGALGIDVQAHEVQIGGVPVHLTPTEFALLHHLAAHPGQVMTRQVLLDRVWGDDYYGDERTVDVHIRHLRGKLKQVDPTEYVVAVRGVGYKFGTAS